MPVLAVRRESPGRSHSTGNVHGGLLEITPAPVYSLLVASGAVSASWLPGKLHDDRPVTMLQPVDFEGEPSGRLRLVRLRPVDESEDHW